MTIEELIYHTQELMKIRSTTDNPEALKNVVDYIADLVKFQENVTIEYFNDGNRPSLLAYRGKIRPKKFDILLNAHVDVVPAKEDQFNPVIKNGRLYGRGALDMKGTAITLTDCFCKMVNKVPYSLGLQIVSDEEIGGYNGVRYQIEQGVRAEFVIMGEYANERNTIYNAARGLCWAEIAFKGKEAHGGHLWHGTNAVLKAGDFAGAVLKRYPTPDKETWTTTASVASISTPNQTFNKVPDSAILKIDFRFTQEDPVFRNEDSVRTFIESIDPDAELIKLSVFEPAVKVEELNPYVQGLSNAIKSITHSDPNYMSRPAASDGRHFSMVENDIIEFGLFGMYPHSKREYVELSSFKEYQEILLSFLDKPIPTDYKDNPVMIESPQLKHLRNLISSQSVTSNTTANNYILKEVSQFLANRGMHIHEYEKDNIRSFVATTKPGNKKPKVLLVAHTDVVPADEKMFNLTVDGDKLTGRGVMDMKFAIASYMGLVDNLKGELSDYDFGIMLTCDEEVGGRRGVDFLVNEHGYRPDVAIVPDGGENWELETFAKGVQWIKLTANGKVGHASRPWEGVSAIQSLLSAIREIELLFPSNPAPEDSILSVGTLEGGTTANQIPVSAVAMLDIRYGNPEDFKRIVPAIENICKKLEVNVSVEVNDAPYRNDPENPYIKVFTDLIEETTGEKHKNSYSFGVTDGRFFSYHGIPCISIEPPSGNRHKDDEWLSKTGFNQFCEIVEQYVRHVADINPNSEPDRNQDVARLAKRINADNEKAYVWYATFASGLSKEYFTTFINGGKLGPSNHICSGCRDKTPPVKDKFTSLPYKLFFAGKSKLWTGIRCSLELELNEDAHTIARAYLITVEQFEDIAAQENLKKEPLRLPILKALRNGHATIEMEGEPVYDELLYCGTFDKVPVFSLTHVFPNVQYAAPSLVYTKMLAKGLSENSNLSRKTAVDYLASTPGIAGNHKKQTIERLFKETDKDS